MGIPDARRAGWVFARTVATFIVEHYLPGSTAVEREGDVARIHRARAALSGGGTFHVSSVIVDVDEMCMHFFDADEAATVVAAHARAGLQCDRIVEVRTPLGDLPTASTAS